MFRINNIKIRRDISDSEVLDIAIKQNHIDKDDIIEWNIAKKSIDARKKEDVHYSYSINIKVKNENKYKKFEKIKIFETPAIMSQIKTAKKPIIIGAGPAGLFASIILIQNGIKPIIIEQGRFC